MKYALELIHQLPDGTVDKVLEVVEVEADSLKLPMECAVELWKSGRPSTLHANAVRIRVNDYVLILEKGDARIDPEAKSKPPTR